MRLINDKEADEPAAGSPRWQDRASLHNGKLSYCSRPGVTHLDCAAGTADGQRETGNLPHGFRAEFLADPAVQPVNFVGVAVEFLVNASHQHVHVLLVRFLLDLPLDLFEPVLNLPAVVLEDVAELLPPGVEGSREEFLVAGDAAGLGLVCQPGAGPGLPRTVCVEMGDLKFASFIILKLRNLKIPIRERTLT